MTPEARFERIERALEQMAMRQQYHDEASDRMDERLRKLAEGLAELKDEVRVVKRFVHETSRTIRTLG